jgi:hypothetical protein
MIIKQKTIYLWYILFLESVLFVFANLFPVFQLLGQL